LTEQVGSIKDLLYGIKKTIFSKEAEGRYISQSCLLWGSQSQKRIGFIILACQACQYIKTRKRQITEEKLSPTCASSDDVLERVL